MSKLAFKRVLLKVSGEALMGEKPYGIDLDTVGRIAGEVKQCVDAGVQLALVIGGGNIFRGLAGAAKGMDRVSADHMGIMATVMNALAMQGVLENKASTRASFRPSPCRRCARPIRGTRAFTIWSRAGW